jgi:hypothetical protein
MTMTTFTNTTVDCLTCGLHFAFSAQEQQRFAERGWEPPKRCREHLRQQRERDRAAAERWGEW